MSTYSSLNYHLIFSTKRRVHSIEKEWMPRLHAYLGGTIRSFGAVPLEVGGVTDHVHILMSLRPIHAPAEIVREIKKSASVWVHEQVFRPSFAWQEGYAILSVSHDVIPVTRAYIQNQELHHRDRGSHEELLAICQEYGIDVNEEFFV